jgi:hypothetical protein
MQKQCILSEYCKDKTICPNLDTQTKQYYNNLCAKNNETLRKTLVSFSGADDKIEAFIQGLIQPETLAILSAYYGVDLSAELVYKGLLKYSINGVVDKAAIEAAEKVLAASGEKISSKVTVGLLTKLFDNAVEKTIASRIAFNSLKMLGSAVSSAWDGLMMVQLIGMVIDMWDPCGYNQIVDTNVIDGVNSYMNTIFYNQTYFGISPPCDPTDKKCLEKEKDPVKDGEENGFVYTFSGDKILKNINNIPMEYQMDYLFNLNEKDFKNFQYTIDGKTLSYDDYYGDGGQKFIEYVVEYTSNMKVNAIGDPIQWNDGTTLPITLDNFQKTRDTIAFLLANKNTVVEKWLATYWIYILLIILTLIFILLIIK